MTTTTPNKLMLHSVNEDELVKKGVLDEDPRTAEEKYEEAIEVCHSPSRSPDLPGPLHG